MYFSGSSFADVSKKIENGGLAVGEEHLISDEYVRKNSEILAAFLDGLSDDFDSVIVELGYADLKAQSARKLAKKAAEVGCEFSRGYFENIA